MMQKVHAGESNMDGPFQTQLERKLFTLAITLK
jgi:hypothetical protein